MASPEDRERGFSDVEPRNAWAVANAVTRVARSWPAARQQAGRRQQPELRRASNYAKSPDEQRASTWSRISGS